LENWHTMPKYKETNEFLKREGVKGEARKMTSETFLKALLARLKVKNFLAPDQACTLNSETFEVMMKNVVMDIVKTRNEKLLDYVDPIVKKLREKRVNELDTIGHTYREAVKLMFARGLISGPGEYIVIFS